TRCYRDWSSDVCSSDLWITDREAVLKIGAVAVEHEHAENFIVDVALNERGGARQDFIEVQRGVHFIADFSERRQNFGGKLLPARSEERRVGKECSSRGW